MSAQNLQDKVPRLTVPTIVLLLVVSLLYSLFISQTVGLWFVTWGTVVSVAATVLFLYLFYRLVVAVERIADSH
jgi:hypothetical protein